MKEFLKHGVIYGLSSALQNILSFLLLPLLTSYYNTTEYGVYSIIILTGTLSYAIFYLGAGSALGRYYYEYEKRTITTSALLISIFGSLLLIILSYFLKSKLSIALFQTVQYSDHLFFGFIGTSLSILINVLTLVLRYEKKSKLFLIISLTSVLLNFIFTYHFLVNLKLGILAPIFGTLFSNGIILTFLTIRLFKIFKITISKVIINRLIIFGFLSSLNSILFFLLDWIDRLILNDILSLSDVGIYSFGYKLGAVINILLVMPFNLVWGPLRLEKISDKHYDSFVTNITTYYILLGVIIISISTLYSSNLIKLFFNNSEFHEASSVIPIIMTSLLFYGLQSILDFGIYYHNKLHYYLIISLIGIFINVSLNYLLIPRFGYISAAFTTLISYITTTSILHFISIKYYSINLDKKRIVKLFSIVMLTYAITKILDSNTTNITSLFIKLIYCVFILFYLYKFWLNTDEKKIIIKLAKNN